HGTTGLTLAGQVQTRQQGQGQDRLLAEGKAVGHRQDDPVMAAGGGDSLLGAGHGIAPPPQAPDTLAALMGQGVIDQQGEATEEAKSAEDQDSNLISKSGGRPGGT